MLSQSTISSLGSRSFGRNQFAVNIKQRDTLEVANTETVMAYNKDLDIPTLQDISNVFAAVDLSSCSSSDSNKSKRAWLKDEVIRSSILSSMKCPDSCSIALSIAPNHKEIASIIAANTAILPKQYANAIT